MANLIAFLQTIEHESKGEPVRNAIISSLVALDEQCEVINDAITSGEAYRLISSLRDAGEVQY